MWSEIKQLIHVCTKVVERVREPARAVPPEGVEDFDLANITDPQQHSEYAMEVFEYYKQREQAFRIPSYIGENHEITELMR
jgi:hypothetical protein